MVTIMDLNISYTFLVSTVCAVASVFMIKVFSRLNERSDLAKRRKRRQNDRQVAIQEMKENLKLSVSDDDVECITELSTSCLLAELKSGRLQPAEVLVAYQKKALDAQVKTNCIAEFITEATKWSEQLTEADPERTGLLYGLPVSLKEHYSVKGYDCTMGFSKYLFKPMAEDCVIVKVLKQEGAIPFVKTNLPQMTAGVYCSNPIYGGIKNPQDTSRATGGSSGGEGAILGSRASSLGFGNDLGGSIRDPATFCGVCGFKPTTGRLSLKGLRELLPGQRCVFDSYGPMAQDVETIALAMKALLGKHMFMLDPSVPPITFQQNIYESEESLRIGYYLSDSMTTPDPAVHRAVMETKTALEKMGHKLLPWEPKTLGRSLMLWQKAVLGDACSSLAKYFRGEVMDRILYGMIPALYLPVWLKLLLAKITSFISPDLSQKIHAAAGVGSVSEWWKLVAETEDYSRQFFAEWQRLGLDAVICPVSSHQAPPIDKVDDVDGASEGYTMVQNVVNCPAGVVPVTVVKQEDLDSLTDYPTPDKLHKAIKQCLQGAVGLPVAVQCYTRPWQEELCLRLMRDIQTATSERIKHN